MADNYTRGSETFRSKDVSGVESPIMIVGGHVRVYKDTQTLVLNGSPKSLTVPSGATHADIYAQGATSADIARYWHGGFDTVSASSGKRIKDHEEITSNDPATFSAINSTGTVTLFIEYYAYE